MANKYPKIERLEPAASAGAEQRGAFDWLLNMPYWALSALIHLVLMFVFLNVVWQQAKAPEKAQATIIFGPRHVPATKPKPYRPDLPRDVKATPEIPGRIAEVPFVPKNVDVEITADIPKGTSLENHIDRLVVEVSPGINDSLGTAGGAGGPYGVRWGDEGRIRECGGGTEEAVRAALEWLRRHQSADGSWKCRDFTEMCKKPCMSENAERYGDGRGYAEHDVGVTALALLAFTGSGHTHRAGIHPEYVECAKRAMEYLKSVQVRSADPNVHGRYGSDKHEQWIYDHSIATMAMAELLAMSGDVIALEKSVTDATNLCLNAQNPGWGWKYGMQPGKSDTSVTGWMVLALKAAKYCRLDIPEERFEGAFKGALAWFERATSSASGRCGYEQTGDSGSQLLKTFPEPYPYSKSLSCMTAVSVLCRIFVGEPRSAPGIKAGVELLMKQKPLWAEQKGRSLSTINMYYWYYASFAMFQYGGKPWHEWNEAMKDALVRSQRHCAGLDEDGSWDPIDEWSPAGGRVYSTAIGALTLEVYSRFERQQ